jgi:hypothetical protein
VDFFLLMVVMMVLLLKRVEKRPGVTPATFPPPVFAGTTSVFVVRVSPPPRFVIVEGVSIYRHFRGSWASRDEDRGPRRLEAQTG